MWWVKKYSNVEKFEAIKMFKTKDYDKTQSLNWVKTVLVMRLTKAASDAMVAADSALSSKSNSYDTQLNHGLLQIVILDI